jgi:hypothetical protein
MPLSRTRPEALTFDHMLQNLIATLWLLKSVRCNAPQRNSAFVRKDKRDVRKGKRDVRKGKSNFVRQDKGFNISR